MSKDNWDRINESWDRIIVLMGQIKDNIAKVDAMIAGGRFKGDDLIELLSLRVNLEKDLKENDRINGMIAEAIIAQAKIDGKL